MYGNALAEESRKKPDISDDNGSANFLVKILLVLTGTFLMEKNLEYVVVQSY